MLYPAELTGQAPQRSGRRWRSSARRAPQLAQEHRRMEAGIGERRNARPQSARTRHRPQSAVEVSGRRSSSLANPWRARAVACHARPVHHGERVGVTSIFAQRPPIVTRRTLTAIGSSSLLREHDSTPSTVTRGRVRRACGCPSVGGHRILPTGAMNDCPLTAIRPLSVIGKPTFASAAYRHLSQGVLGCPCVMGHAAVVTTSNSSPDTNRPSAPWGRESPRISTQFVARFLCALLVWWWLRSSSPVRKSPAA